MNIQLNRRSFLSGLLTLTAFTAAGLSSFVRYTFAMGKKDYPQGIHEIKGDVKINGQPAKSGDVVKPGDLVTTGTKSQAVFVIARDAYLLRENTQIRIESYKQGTKDQAAELLHILRGKVLGVFSKGNKRITTPTAVIGIRGTGMYIESEPERSYVCTCYGTFDISSKFFPDASEKLQAKHHENARYIYKNNSLEQIIVKAPMKNHADKELIMLESLTGRKPPFVIGKAKENENGGNGGGY